MQQSSPRASEVRESTHLLVRLHDFLILNVLGQPSFALLQQLSCKQVSNQVAIYDKKVTAQPVYNGGGGVAWRWRWRVCSERVTYICQHPNRAITVRNLIALLHHAHTSHLPILLPI